MCAHAPHSNHKLELGDFFLRVLKKIIFQFTKKVLVVSSLQQKLPEYNAMQ